MWVTTTESNQPLRHCFGGVPVPSVIFHLQLYYTMPKGLGSSITINKHVKVNTKFFTYKTNIIRYMRGGPNHRSNLSGPYYGGLGGIMNLSDAHLQTAK